MTSTPTQAVPSHRARLSACVGKHPHTPTVEQGRMTTGSKGKRVVLAVSRASGQKAMNLPTEKVDPFKWD